MLASVYVKDGRIHFYNESKSYSNIGGVAYELGKSLLNFVCYEQDRFDDSFSITASAFEDEYAYLSVKAPEFISFVNESMAAFQQDEPYVYFYRHLFFEFIYNFVESPRKAVEILREKIPDAEEKLGWVKDLEWPISSLPFIQVLYADKEKRLYRAAMGVVSLLSEDFRRAREATIFEIELLLILRERFAAENIPPMKYLHMLDSANKEHTGRYHFLEIQFRAFYGAVGQGEIAELYEVNTIKDLLRFEFIKMIEHDIFIKKCKNCERFFIPRCRSDTDYCDRTFQETGRKCSEIGAMRRYEQKVAENPILDAHKKAYRRFNSRVRTKKMTQNEFRMWSDEAAKRRDACLAGKIPFDEFVAWLEQGRVRKRRTPQA